MFKIQLAEGFYKNKSGRIQHFSNKEKADAKINKMGIAANVVECKAKTAASTKEEPKEQASNAKVPKVKTTKKAAVKPEKPASSKSKTKKNKKA